MANKRKCLICNGCMIQVYRNNNLYWHCSFCEDYYKALAGGKIVLVPKEDVLKIIFNKQT